MYADRVPSSGSPGTGRPPVPAPADPVLTPPRRAVATTPLRLTLASDAVTFVDDAAGRWQHERGRVSDHSTEVGVYASTARLPEPGTEPDEATFTLTVFLLRVAPPQTITVQGPYRLGSDHQTGSVSAASAGHADRVGNAFTRSGDAAVID